MKKLKMYNNKVAFTVFGLRCPQRNWELLLSIFLRKCVCFTFDVCTYVRTLIYTYVSTICMWKAFLSIFIKFMCFFFFFLRLIHIFRNMVLTHQTVKNRYCFRKRTRVAADDAHYEPKINVFLLALAIGSIAAT